MERGGGGSLLSRITVDHHLLMIFFWRGRGGRYIRGVVTFEHFRNKDEEELDSDKFDLLKCPMPFGIIRKAGNSYMITIASFRYIKMQVGSEAWRT